VRLLLVMVQNQAKMDVHMPMELQLSKSKMLKEKACSFYIKPTRS
jgi:hypothetical protein